MKKAIFLVEEIENGKPITFLEKLYSKLLKDSHKRKAYFGYIEEIPTLLAATSGFITFKSVYDFMEEVKTSGIPTDVDIFYFISTWQEIKTFGLANLLALDPEVMNFLVEHKIAFILDGSIESGHTYKQCEEIFEHNYNEFVNNRRSLWNGLQNLPFYVVTAGVVNGSSNNRNFDIRHRMFVGSFFHKVYDGCALHQHAKDNRDQIFNQIDNRKITDDTLVWQAFQRSSRITKILFQYFADKKGLTNYGEYSRARGCKVEYQTMHEQLGLVKYDLPFQGIDIDRLDLIKIISDSKDQQESTIIAKILDGADESGIFNIFPMRSMLHVVLETCCVHREEDFANTPSQLTEKSSLAILSGMPFIPCGGHQLGTFLKMMGFKEYPGLEFPTQPNYMDELNHVIEKLENIINMTVEQRQALYDSWKDILKYNYDHMLNLNAQEMYLKFLNTEIEDLKIATDQH